MRFYPRQTHAQNTHITRPTRRRLEALHDLFCTSLHIINYWAAWSLFDRPSLCKQGEFSNCSWQYVHCVTQERLKLHVSKNVVFRTRMLFGMSTIPAYNAVRHGLLHIGNFCHAPFILRLAFEGGNENKFAKRLWQNAFAFECIRAFYYSLFHFRNFRRLPMKIFTIIKT